VHNLGGAETSRWSYPICFFCSTKKQIDNGKGLRHTMHRHQNARHGTYRQNAWNAQQQDTKHLIDFEKEKISFLH